MNFCNFKDREINWIQIDSKQYLVNMNYNVLCPGGRPQNWINKVFET